ncbi:MAG: RNA-binding protein [Desulfobulbus propionicus]|nr:MAG: RNA-binding protein [Desulfobulbus propionicus]
MDELARFMASRLVDNPDAVDVSMVETDDLCTIQLRVAKEDLGKVIGKQGRTARAMRSLLAAVAAQEKKQSRLEIVE